MDDSTKRIDRLLRSAAQVSDESPAAAPFGFDTRVVALWRASGSKPNGLVALLRRVALLAAAITVIATAAAVRQVGQNREIGDSITNEFAIADSAIQNEF
jgi:hypothetical protein